MKSLTGKTNITDNYLKQGNRPRVLVHVADARDGTVEGRYWASQSHTTSSGVYSDRIYSTGSIRNTIEPFGGMSSVSGTNLSILKSDTNIKFHQSVTLDTEPHPGVASEGHGRFVKSGTPYVTIYNATSADGIPSNSSLAIGRNFNGSTYYIYRSFLQWAIPVLSSIEDAYITLTGTVDNSNVDFTIEAYEGTWSNGQYSILSFDDFNSDNLIESFTTLANPIVNGSTYYLRFNRTGRDLISSYSNSIFSIMLVSSLDDQITVTGPTGAEFVRFNPSVMPTLTLQYNTVKPDNRTTKIYIGYADSTGTLPTNETSMLQLWTGVVDKYTLSPTVFDMQLRHDDFRHNVLIPDRLIRISDFENCPETNIGKPYPIVYGKASTAEASSGGIHANGIGREESYVPHPERPHNVGLFDYFPSPVVDPGIIAINNNVPLGNAFNNPIWCLVSRKIIQYVYRYGWIAYWDSGTNSYGRFVGLAEQIVQPNSDGYVTRIVPDLRTGQEGYVETYRGTAISIIPTFVTDYHLDDSGDDPEDIFTTTGGKLQKEGDYIVVGFPMSGSSSSGDLSQVAFSALHPDTDGKFQVDVIKAEMYQRGDTETTGTVTWVNATRIRLTDLNATWLDDGVVVTDQCELDGALTYYLVGSVANTIIDLQANYTNQDAIDAVYTAGAVTSKIRIPGAVIDSISGIDVGTIGTADWALNFTDDLQYAPDKTYIKFGIDSTNTFTTKATIKVPQIRHYTDSPETLTELYFDKYGELDIDGVITAGGTNTLYENPADIIRAIAVYHGNLSNLTEINDTSFTDAQTILINWNFDFQLPVGNANQLPLFTFNGKKGILHDLAEQCKSSVFFDHQGKLKIKVFNDTDTFPNSGTNTPNDLDIFEYSGSPSSDSFTRHGIVPNSFNIQMIEIDDVYNDYVLKYHYNYGLDDYDRTLYITNGSGDDSSVETNITSGSLGSTSTLAQLKLYVSDSYTALNSKTNQMVYEAWAIRREATANKFLQSLIEWYSRRRYIVEFDTYFSAIAFEEADFINIRTPDIEDIFGTATMYTKKWKIIDFSPNLSNFTIHIEAIEAEIY